MKYRTGYKFQLAEDEIFLLPSSLTPDEDIFYHSIHLTTDGKMRVKAEYAWDGASGPIKTMAWILEKTSKWLWKKYIKKFIRGSCGHDAFCELLRQGKIPPCWLSDINAYLYQDLVKDGMSEWRASGWVKTLDQFDFYADPKNKKKIYEAP